MRPQWRSPPCVRTPPTSLSAPRIVWRRPEDVVVVRVDGGSPLPRKAFEPHAKIGGVVLEEVPLLIQHHVPTPNDGRMELIGVVGMGGTMMSA